MKIHRSTKCTLKFSTKTKRQELKTVLAEYGRVCQWFIDYFWVLEKLPTKSQLIKEIVNLPKDETNLGTWLSSRACKVAAREALDMIQAVRKRWAKNPKKITKPKHPRNRIQDPGSLHELQEPKDTSEFDSWLHLSSLGNRTIIDLPVRKHQHFNKYDKDPEWKRCNSIILTDKYVQFVFEKEIEDELPKIDLSGLAAKINRGLLAGYLGLDTGIKKLASLSDGSTFGTDIESFCSRKKACRASQTKQTKAIRSMRHRMDTIASDIIKR